MNRLKSHNDYWNYPETITRGKRAGCNVFEMDVILSFGRLRCSHSWRPFGYGSAREYIERFLAFSAPADFLQVDLKCQGKIAEKKLLELFSDFPELKGRVFVSAKNNWLNTGREDLKKRIMEKTGFRDYAELLPIDSVDLYGNSICFFCLFLLYYIVR